MVSPGIEYYQIIPLSDAEQSGSNGEFTCIDPGAVYLALRESQKEYSNIRINKIINKRGRNRSIQITESELKEAAISYPLGLSESELSDLEFATLA